MSLKIFTFFYENGIPDIEDESLSWLSGTQSQMQSQDPVHEL